MIQLLEEHRNLAQDL